MIRLALCVVMLVSMPLFAQEQQLLVGIAGLDMRPRIGIPLAGYGSKQRRLKGFFDWRSRYPDSTLFKPSEGYHSPIRSKVMLLKKGTQHLVFISLDTIGTEDRFVQDVSGRLEKYGIREKDIIMAATHTHGGPGTLSKRAPLMAIAVDLYKEKNYLDILNKVTGSVEEALKNLRPANLYKTKAEINGVQRNKWRRKDEEHFDKRASFLMAKDAQTNEWLGGLVNFSIHGGTMPIPLMLYSSDVNGAIEKELEDFFAVENGFSFHRPTILFMNGAEGDVGGNSDRTVEAVDMLSRKFIEEAAPQLAADKWTPVAPEFSSVKKKVFVGIPGLPLNCQGGLFKRAPAWMKIKIYPLLPASSFISQARVGDMLFMTYPGEPSTQLGYDLQAMAQSKGVVDPIILGLVNDYMTYFTNKEEFAEKRYDSCSSLYGWRGAQRIFRAHEKLIQ
jgi:neutral ceramidase